MSKMVIDYEAGCSTVVKSLETKAIVRTDVPQNYGGKGQEFSPTDLFAAALGSCILSMMGMQAKKIGVSFEGVKAAVTKNQGAIPGGIGEILVHIYSPHTFDPAIQGKLEQAAHHCPVHQCIDPKVRQEILFHWGQAL